ncbi:hypothetical protein PIB30_070964 [Stylosanthes scabra]|uniref:Uncharacterized protein n=1 Tax=Stylosanthes scabra TaxID=79078 RepID=A0ABU6VR39_9FABA|nr:hypothetical protein [Stylosanthes scabra]
MDSLWLDESRFITCGKPKIHSRHLLKLHNNRGKVGAFSLRKHLEPCQFQEKLVDLQSDGWTNQVWDPGESYKNKYFWGLVTYLGIFASLMYMIWNPINNTKSKYWWKFIDSVGILRSLAKFGAEVAKESARNEKIAKKSLKAKSRAYAYAPKGPMRTHCHALGVIS